ncbi:MAG: tetratricopeptide repeat protein [Tatlockia sp.]|jgi:TPR repeat protein
MRSVFKLIGMLLILCITACVRHSNLNEGITCFHTENYRAAFIYLKPEAEKGQPDAQYAIGYMYYYGKGVVENRKQACIWITRAAKAGQPDARIALKIIKDQPRVPTKKDPLDPLIYTPHG